VGGVTRRRRAALLIGLAAVLGGLAASDVGRREAALRAQLGPAADVVVARRALPPGRILRLEDLGIRRMPSRYAPPGELGVPVALVGRKLGVAVPAGGALSGALATVSAPAGPVLRRGERAAAVVATGDLAALAAGARVDVLVTRERADGIAGGSRLALEDVEVLAASAAPDEAGSQPAGTPRVRATLRVTPRQAVYLAAAQAFASEIRLLARAPGDRGRLGPLSVGDGL
jgi:pilus assembly protein CpaB